MLPKAASFNRCLQHIANSAWHCNQLVYTCYNKPRLSSTWGGVGRNRWIIHKKMRTTDTQKKGIQTTPAHATTNVVIYVFVIVASTRFRARCRQLTMVANHYSQVLGRVLVTVAVYRYSRAVQTPDKSFVLVSPA